jgi:hypothetical protein
MTEMGGQYEYKWDLFLSYASQDREWVLKNLYYPLLQCIDKHGNTPAIFFDKDALPIAENFMIALSGAVRKSRCLIAVLSPAYYDNNKSGWTEYEFNMAFMTDPLGKSERKKVVPLLIDQAALSSFSQMAGYINVLDITHENWFGRLIESLELKRRDEILSLHFESIIPDSVVSHTIPLVTVAVPAGRTQWRETVVELTAPGNILQGTLKKQTVNGKAEFSDLSFIKDIHAIRITAAASGYKFVESNQFSVLAQEKIVIPVESSPVEGCRISSRKTRLVPCSLCAQLRFFENGKAFTILETAGEGVRCSVYNLDAEKTGEISIPARIKSTCADRDRIVLIDWTGILTIVKDDGTCKQIDLCPPATPYVIPGSCVIFNDDIITGLWNGDLVRTNSDCESEVLFKHTGGIQYLSINDTGLYITDFNGMFCDIRDQMIAFSFPIEQLQVGLQSFGNYILIAGERNIYQYRCATATLIPWEQSAAKIMYIIPALNRMITVNQKGHGMFIDEQLRISSEFHVTPGSQPYYYGERDNCSFVSFAYPNGAGALLVNSQVVYTHAAGILTFDRSVKSVAARTDAGITILDYSWLANISSKV